MHIRLALSALLLVPAALPAQDFHNAAAVAEQKDAIAKLAFLHGEWRGSVKISGPQGQTTLIQTERAGPMLGGTILVIEGRAYTENGDTAFNAFAVISYDSDADSYWMNSWNAGRTGRFPLTLTEDGFAWETPGPNGAVIRYRAAVKDGHWKESGSFERPGGPAFPFVDLDVTRLGDTAWPADGAVAPR